MNRKAFTLIELLVVVAIIGILAAVGVVAYNGYTSSAKKAVTKANHKIILNTMVSQIQMCEVDEHLNGPGHSLHDMQILALEKVFTPGQRILEKRESLYINKLEAEYSGLNRKQNYFYFHFGT